MKSRGSRLNDNFSDDFGKTLLEIGKSYHENGGDGIINICYYIIADTRILISFEKRYSLTIVPIFKFDSSLN